MLRELAPKSSPHPSSALKFPLKLCDVIWSQFFFLCAEVSIEIMWCNMEPILLLCGQDKSITILASTYIVFSLSDLIKQAFLHTLRIYLRTQKLNFLFFSLSDLITQAFVHPLTIYMKTQKLNFLLVVYLNMGSEVALAAVCTNFNLVLGLICYFDFIYRVRTRNPGKCHQKNDSKGEDHFWVCLFPAVHLWTWNECWYEIMIIFGGLLLHPKATVAATGTLIQTTTLLYILPSSLSVGVSARVGKAWLSMIVNIACAVVMSFIAVFFSLRWRCITHGYNFHERWTD